MSDAGGELSDGLKLLGLAQLFFQGFVLGQVGADNQKSLLFSAWNEVDVDNGQTEEASLTVSLKHRIRALLRFIHAKP